MLNELLHMCMGQAYNIHLNDPIVLQNKAMWTILTVKHIFNYSNGLFMFKYSNNMTSAVFDNFFRNLCNLPRQRQEENKISNAVVLIFGVSSSKVLI